MGLNRYFYRPITPGHLTLIGPEVHHMTRVMRQKPGDELELFDGRGTLARARIESVDKKAAQLTILEYRQFPQPNQYQIILLVSLARNDRFDWLISKCCELGVDRICPTIFQRTVKQAANPKVTQRYTDLAIAAAKQCKRLFLPVIDSPQPLNKVLSHWTAMKDTQIFFGHFGPQALSIRQRIPITKHTAIVIGPEGGYTDQEIMAIEAAGAQAVRLTDTVLRIETAAVAFTSILAAFRTGSDDNP